MTEPTIQQHTIEQFTSLEELYSLCQDDNWLMGFIQDTENHRMVKVPVHMKEETLKQISSPLSSPGERRISPSAITMLKDNGISCRRIKNKPLSKHMELFLYSLRVSAATMGAIIVLFLAPPSLKLLHTTFSNSAMEFSNVFYLREVQPNE